MHQRRKATLGFGSVNILQLGLQKHHIVLSIVGILCRLWPSLQQEFPIQTDTGIAETRTLASRCGFGALESRKFGIGAR